MAAWQCPDGRPKRQCPARRPSAGRPLSAAPAAGSSPGPRGSGRGRPGSGGGWRRPEVPTVRRRSDPVRPGLPAVLAQDEAAPMKWWPRARSLSLCDRRETNR